MSGNFISGSKSLFSGFRDDTNFSVVKTGFNRALRLLEEVDKGALIQRFSPTMHPSMDIQDSKSFHDNRQKAFLSRDLKLYKLQNDKKTTELVVTLKMLYSDWISRKNWGNRFRYDKAIIIGLLNILPDFFEDQSIKLIFAEYLKLYNYSISYERMQGMSNYVFHKMLCNMIVSGEMVNFFAGSYHTDISDKIRDNELLMHTYTETFRIVTNDTIVEEVKLSNEEMLRYHLTLKYHSELYHVHDKMIAVNKAFHGPSFQELSFEEKSLKRKSCSNPLNEPEIKKIKTNLKILIPK